MSRLLLLWLVGLAIVLTVAAVGLWTAPRWLVPVIAARSPRCLYTVTAREKVVALTIDDGPDREEGTAILAVLRENRAHATFFLISGNVPGAEALVADVVSAGHEIGNHLTRDEPSIRLSPTAFVAAMREAGTMLGRFAEIRWLRPGSGWYNDTMLEAIEREGYRCALGSVYPYDGHGMPARPRNRHDGPIGVRPGALEHREFTRRRCSAPGPRVARITGLTKWRADCESATAERTRPP